MFPNGPENHLKELEQQVQVFKQRGDRPPQSLLDKVEDQKGRVKANNEAKELHEKGRADAKAADIAKGEKQVEDAMKAEALRAHMVVGGKAADFEAKWPGLREKIIEERTLEQLRGNDAAIAAKRKSGLYSGF